MSEQDARSLKIGDKVRVTTIIGEIDGRIESIGHNNGCLLISWPELPTIQWLYREPSNMPEFWRI